MWSCIARTLPHWAPGDERVADVQRAALDEHRRHRAAARVEMRLDHGAGGRRVRVGLQLLDLGEQEDVLEQLVEVLLRLRRDVDEDRVAAPVLGGQALVAELALDLVGVGALEVDLVDRDEDRHVGGAGVVDRLDRLRHHAVVGGDDDHDDVGDVGAAGAHRGERGVARRVDEGDRLAVLVHLVGADVLGDPAGLAGDDLGLADRVEQRGLAVVDVAHDRDHRRAVGEVLVGVVVDRRLDRLLGGADDLDLAVERARRAPRSVSSESVWVSVAISPSCISCLITSALPTPKISATSRTVAPEGILSAGCASSTTGAERRLLQQRPAAAAAATPRRAPRRRVLRLVAARGLRVDHDPAALLARLRRRRRRRAAPGEPASPRRPAAPGRGASPRPRAARAASVFAGLVAARLASRRWRPRGPSSASASSTLDAAALASIPAAFSAARTSLLVRP